MLTISDTSGGTCLHRTQHARSGLTIALSVLARALPALEDAIEVTAPRADRAPLRALRRQLEDTEGRPAS